MNREESISGDLSVPVLYQNSPNEFESSSLIEKGNRVDSDELRNSGMNASVSTLQIVE